MHQLDLIHNNPAALARAYRTAADVAAIDPHFPRAEREQRAAHYIAEAERYERRTLEDTRNG